MRRQSRLRPRFAVCIKNKGYEAALERGKVYRMIPDSEAAKHGYVRIVDESGEDYGYFAGRFIAINLLTAAAFLLLIYGITRRWG
jgi:hypothetical protein